LKPVNLIGVACLLGAGLNGSQVSIAKGVLFWMCMYQLNEWFIRLTLQVQTGLGENLPVLLLKVHASSHWQPKSQGYMPHNHRGSSRANGGQRVSSRVGKAPKADYPNHRGEHQGSRTDKEYSEALVHPHSDKSNEQKTVVAGQPNVHQQEAKPERKRTDSPKQGPCFVDKHSPNPAKLDSPANVDSPHEQPNSG
ncbi:hypothetical protein FRX31_019209, partial [Thalictrum thalictroides]